MADPRTKWEFLYQEALGDVAGLVTRLEALKTEIPALTGEAAGKLNIQIGQLLEAANKVQGKLDDAVKSAATQIARAGQQEVVNLKREVREGAREAAVSALGAATGEAVERLAAARAELEAAASTMREAKPDSGFRSALIATTVGGTLAILASLFIWAVAERPILSAVGALPAAEKRSVDKELACARLLPVQADKTTKGAILTLCQ